MSLPGNHLVYESCLCALKGVDLAKMYSLKNGTTVHPVQLNGINNPRVNVETFPTAKSVRISDESSYFGSTRSGSSKKGDASGNNSLGSTYFFSIMSDVSEQDENGKFRLIRFLFPHFSNAKLHM